MYSWYWQKIYILYKLPKIYSRPWCSIDAFLSLFTLEISKVWMKWNRAIKKYSTGIVKVFWYFDLLSITSVWKLSCINLSIHDNYLVFFILAMKTLRTINLSCQKYIPDCAFALGILSPFTFRILKIWMKWNRAMQKYTTRIVHGFLLHCPAQCQHW